MIHNGLNIYDMKLFREVKASERLPIICDEWYITDCGRGYFDFGTWYSTDALDKDSTYEIAINWWLEPIEITEEEIIDIVKSWDIQTAFIDLEDEYSILAKAILSKLKGD